MTLTRKTALTLFIAFALVMLIQTMISRHYLLNQFETIEQEKMLRSMQLLVDRVRIEREQIRIQAQGWGQWDDMYDYMTRPSLDFEQSYFNVISHEYTETDAIMVFNRELQLIHGQWFNKAQHQIEPVASQVEQTLAQALAQLNRDESQATVINLGDVFYFVGVSPILTSTQEGPSRGSLVMARQLDSKLTSNLLAKTNGQLSFQAPDADNSASVFEQDSIRFFSEASTIRGEATISDWLKHPTLRIALSEPRDIYKQGIVSLRYSLIFVALAGAVVMVVIFIALQKLVLKRLIHTRNVLREIGEKGEDAARLASNRNDEISEVNRSINAMLDALSRNKDIERRQNLLVRERLETLTQLTWSVAMQAEHDDIIWPDILTACSRHFSDSYSAVYVLDDNRVQLRLQHANHPIWQNTVSCNTAPKKWDDIFSGKRRTVLFEANEWPHVAGETGQLMLAALTRKKEFIGVLALMHKTQSWRDADGDFIASIARIASQAMARQADSLSNKALRQQAQTDALTGLANRTALFEHLDYVLNRVRVKSQINAVLFIDLDGFKAINDELGHGSGDRVLIQLGFRLQKLMRANDMVARLGGDEFVVVLDQINDVGVARKVAEKILEKINEPVQLPEQNAQLGCSIGIALYPEHALNAERLMEHADQAMYIAKKSGKNHIHVFQHGERET